LDELMGKPYTLLTKAERQEQCRLLKVWRQTEGK
jgi:hypothetical protein